MTVVVTRTEMSDVHVADLPAGAFEPRSCSDDRDHHGGRSRNVLSRL
jgi:hypothetical protein